MNTIDLERLLIYYFPFHKHGDIHDSMAQQFDSYDMMHFAKEVCRTALEYAAENATYDLNDNKDIIIDKKSIIDTINQIE